MITDSWGHTHTLYADYLDQGTTVLLKIFYVACPPCNAIAPHLELLYQDWGGGEGDVQFIEISTKQSDTDAMVNLYKSNHGTTFPAAGGQGGSVAATEPYTDGTFGVWSGTPTFIVIAPDGTLEYDVYGFGIDGTIIALDAAIAATGAQGLPTSTNKVPGKAAVSLESNLIRDEIRLTAHESLIDIRISLANITGQVALENSISVFEGESATLDASMLATGIWICTIRDIKGDVVASYLCTKI
jgi:hypothetical protein